MRVVIIDKTYADSDKADPDYGVIYGLMDPGFPLETREEEYPNIGAAKAANPGLTVMNATAYNAMKKVLHVSHKPQIDLILLKDAELRILREGQQ